MLSNDTITAARFVALALTATALASTGCDRNTGDGGARAEAEEPTESKPSADKESPAEKKEPAEAKQPGEARSIARELQRGLAADPSSPRYRILYAQDGIYHPIEDHRVTLEPRPFTMHVLMTPDAKPMVNVSASPTNRDRVVEGEAAKKPVGHPGTGMAAHPHNENRRLMVDDTGSNYWNYDEEGPHSFDEVRDKGGYLEAERSIDSLYVADEKRDIPIEKLAGKAFYAVELKAGGDPMQPRDAKRAYTIAFDKEAGK